MNENDKIHLRHAIEVAQRAVENGNHPFGAVLADNQGKWLLEGENTVLTDNDVTGHAETNLIRDASQRYDEPFLATCTLYASTEPCPMCAGATYWGGIGRVVFGLSQAKLYEIAGDAAKGRRFLLSCRDVLAHAERKVVVVGPTLEDEALKIHQGFWR